VVLGTDTRPPLGEVLGLLEEVVPPWEVEPLPEEVVPPPWEVVPPEGV